MKFYTHSFQKKFSWYSRVCFTFINNIESTKSRLILTQCDGVSLDPPPNARSILEFMKHALIPERSLSFEIEGDDEDEVVELLGKTLKHIEHEYGEQPWLTR